jgi:hypothetical protein
MAKLTPGFGFTGSLSNLSSYEMKGVDGLVVRMKGGPTKKQIKSSPQFINTRRNNAEFGGRATACRHILWALQPHRALADYNFAGPLQAALRPVQLLDIKSEWGEKHILLSKNPRLLEGFSLNKKYIFDSVVRNPLHCNLDRKELKATISIPALMNGINFYPPAFHSLFSISLVLDVVPDIFYKPTGYEAAKGYDKAFGKSFQSEWFMTAKGCPEQSIELKMDKTTPDENFSLMLSVGIRYGMAGANGIEQVPHAGSAKVLAMA